MQRYKDYILKSTYSTGIILLFSYALSIFAQDMNVARAVARTKPVRRVKLAGFRSGFCWLKSGKKIY